ncbi:MAG: TonB-dependent receptor [Saprospiraceae bacterium]|nr:TonB-dependent receptor [Saprospiraceae bacterium]
MRIITLLALSLMLCAHPVMGQFSVSVDTITVRSARVPTPVEQTGRNISVIQPLDLEQAPYTSLDELFQYIPGIEVQSRNAFGSQGDITMRGSTFSQVLVLIDGMRLNDPLTGHFNHAIPVATAEIERVEVLRGAAAAIYGADAVGGVINVITKGYQATAGDYTQIAGQMNYGDNSLVMGRQGFAVQKKNSFFSGGFNLTQSLGESIPERTVNGSTLEGFDNYFDIKTVGVQAGGNLNNGWRFKIRTAYDHRDFSARYFYTVSPFDKSTETTGTWWNQLVVDKVGQISNTQINLAHKRNTDVFVFSPDFASTNEHVTLLSNLNVNHHWRSSKVWAFNIGGQLDRRSIESNDRGDHQDWHVGAYGMAVWSPNTQWTITGSARVDYDENYDLEFTPQLNLAYQVLPNLNLRGSAGRSIRAANYTERYVSFNLTNLTPGRNLGNPDLLAEQSWSEELGFDLDLTPNITWKGTGFLRQSSSLIDYVETNESRIPNNQNLQDGANYFFAQNISDVVTKGFETELWLSHIIDNRRRVRGSIGYTYLNTSNDEDIVSVYISSHARHLLTTQWTLNAGGLDFSVNGLYKVRNNRLAEAIDAELTEQYSLWNVRAAHDLTQNIGIQLQIHNVFDAEYQDILGAPMPGRWVMAGLWFDIR